MGLPSSIYEHIAEAYAVADGHSLALPQFRMDVLGKERWVDVLVVRPLQKRFMLLEITEAKQPKILAKKIQDYRDGAAEIVATLKEHFGFDGDWTVMPWIIARNKSLELYREIIGQEGVEYTSIEQMISEAEPAVIK